ncbi:hypothetical protein FHG87_012217 [Trinorchestia longiramus]|nr:hypothetical protein FHG87_012217 [Trinorchestia longiramus]
MDFSGVQALGRNSILLANNPLCFVPECYLTEEFAAMAASMSPTAPSPVSVAVSYYPHALKLSKHNSNSRNLLKANKRMVLFSSTSQLTESSFHVPSESKSSGPRSRFRKGMSNFMKFRTQKVSESDPSKSFWKGFGSRKSRLSLSALSLSSNVKKKYDAANSTNNLMFTSEKALVNDENVVDQLKQPQNDANWYDLCRSQSCQFISRKNRKKQASTKQSSLQLSQQNSINSCERITFNNSFLNSSERMEYHMSDSSFQSRDGAHSMDDILESIPHIDSSSSDDEDFRKRTLTMKRGVKERPVSSIGRLLPTDDLRNDVGQISSNSGSRLEYISKRKRPSSLMTERNLDCDETFVPGAMKNLTNSRGQSKRSFGSSSHDEFRLEGEEMKPCNRNSHVGDVRASVRLRAKAFKQRAKAFTNRMQKSQKQTYGTSEPTYVNEELSKLTNKECFPKCCVQSCHLSESSEREPKHPSCELLEHYLPVPNAESSPKDRANAWPLTLNSSSPGQQLPLVRRTSSSEANSESFADLNRHSDLPHKSSIEGNSIKFDEDLPTKQYCSAQTDVPRTKIQSQGTSGSEEDRPQKCGGGDKSLSSSHLENAMPLFRPHVTAIDPGLNYRDISASQEILHQSRPENGAQNKSTELSLSSSSSDGFVASQKTHRKLEIKSLSQLDHHDGHENTQANHDERNSNHYLGKVNNSHERKNELLLKDASCKMNDYIPIRDAIAQLLNGSFSLSLEEGSLLHGIVDTIGDRMLLLETVSEFNDSDSHNSTRNINKIVNEEESISNKTGFTPATVSKASSNGVFGTTVSSLEDKHCASLFPASEASCTDSAADTTGYGWEDSCSTDAMKRGLLSPCQLSVRDELNAFYGPDQGSSYCQLRSYNCEAQRQEEELSTNDSECVRAFHELSGLYEAVIHETLHESSKTKDQSFQPRLNVEGRYESHFIDQSNSFASGFDLSKMSELEMKRTIFPSSVNLLRFDSMEAAAGFLTTSLGGMKEGMPDQNLTSCHLLEDNLEIKSKGEESNEVCNDEIIDNSSTLETSVPKSLQCSRDIEPILGSLFLYEHNLRRNHSGVFAASSPSSPLSPRLESVSSSEKIHSSSPCLFTSLDTCACKTDLNELSPPTVAYCDVGLRSTTDEKLLVAESPSQKAPIVPAIRMNGLGLEKIETLQCKKMKETKSAEAGPSPSSCEQTCMGCSQPVLSSSYSNASENGVPAHEEPCHKTNGTPVNSFIKPHAGFLSRKVALYPRTETEHISSQTGDENSVVDELCELSSLLEWLIKQQKTIQFGLTIQATPVWQRTNLNTLSAIRPTGGSLRLGSVIFSKLSSDCVYKVKICTG